MVYPMQDDGQNNDHMKEDTSSEKMGCLQVFLFSAMAAWIILSTLVTQVITWVIEQDLSAGQPGMDARWLILLFYGLVLLFPAVLIWIMGKSLPNRRFFGGFSMAAGFVLLVAPARLAGITSAQRTGGLLIAGMVVFLVVLFFIMPRRSSSWQGTALALLFGALAGYPWLLWGALGSAVDVVLNTACALLFGIAASRVLVFIFLREQERTISKTTLLLEGFAASLILSVMSTGLGVNGNTGFLLLTLPPLGWGLAGLYRQSAGANGRVSSNTPALALLTGLAAFWPTAFVDPDEMAAALSMSAGELAQWAYLASVIGLVIALFAGLALGVQRRDIRRSAALAGVVAAAWLGAAVIYLFPGQPGLYGERLFVILQEQTDVSNASNLDDYALRRSAVYQDLVEIAETSQADLRASLDRWNIPYRPYYLVNAIEVQGGPLVRLWLERRPEVDRVLDSPRLRPLPYALPVSKGLSSDLVELPWNLRMIGADQVWSVLGVTGKGIIIGQSDSGVQGDHPELADGYRGRDGEQDYNWFDPWNGTAMPVDFGGHGTHTLGTALGNRVGVAPDAQWIGCVNLGRNLGNPALYLDCMQFMLAPFPQGGDPFHDGRVELGAHVLNNSWGCPPIEGCDPDALLAGVKALRAAGIFVVSSAGNDGDRGCESVADPIALYDQVYSVGALDSQGNLTSFSSLGPVSVDGSGRVKPDIAAPGDEVLSAFPGNTYASLSGTSMAGPHVAGVVALMWSANPELIGDIDRTEQILSESAAPYEGPLPACVAPGWPNNAVGYGVVNAYQAVLRAVEE